MNREARMANQVGRLEPECRHEDRFQLPIQSQQLILQRLLKKFERFPLVVLELDQRSPLTTGYGLVGQPTYVRNCHYMVALQIG